LRMITTQRMQSIVDNGEESRACGEARESQRFKA
jgi:hypothetical protein